MIKTGQIDIKNQYVLKRKEFRHRNLGAEGSLKSGKQYNITQNKSIQKPLQGGANAQISFKGFDLNLVKKTLKLSPVIKEVPKSIEKKVFQTLSNVSDSQYESYVEIKRNFARYIVENEKFRKENGINDNILAELKKVANGDDNAKLIYLPKKTVFSKFLNQIVSPFTAFYKWGEKILLPKDSPKLKARAEKEKILKDYAAFEGLLRSHEIWENGYRKLSGHKKWTDGENFLIPDAVLEGKLTRRRNKVVDPNKGKYSSNSLMIGNRLISGIVYSYFLGTDAYNTTMRYSNNQQEAANQRKSRVAQEFSRIGMNMYIQNLLFGTFEAAVNRSLPTAMFVSGSTVAFSEILGRKLVGKPIMPSNKEKLDKLENEMYEKKGILPSIGRLLTTAKKKDSNKQITSNITAETYKKTKPNKRLFAAFTDSDNANNLTRIKDNTPSFKGVQINKFFKTDKMIDKDKLYQIYKVIEMVDNKKAESIKKAVMKSIKKSDYFTSQDRKIPETFEKLINSKEIQEIPVGQKETVWGKLTNSILVPVKFVKNLGISVYKLLKKLFCFVTNKKNNELLKELTKLENSSDAKDKKRLENFEKLYNDRMNSDVWKKSPLSEQEKRLRIFSEFKSLKNKNKEEIDGVKNIILWLDKQISKQGIKIQPDGTLSEIDKNKVNKILMDSVKKADGEKQLEYDGNTLAQTNINLSRAITTLFLVTDAYNLTMQYSNDNKKDANRSAKNRAAQEISRIGVSAYIMAFVHNLLSKLCNSSLAGAFTLTALTSSINDSISREVVGVPLTAKSQEELEELDKKNAGSKNPIKKALAYSIGKKSVANAMKVPVREQHSDSNDIDYFSNDFFIKPEIN